MALIDDDPAFAVERRRWQRWAPRVRRADAVVTFSRHGADRAVSALGLDARRVHVVPLAAGPEFRPAPATGLPGEAPAAPPTGPGADAPGPAPSPYVLYVGEYGAHKGFAEAAGVIARLAGAGLPHDLWMAGRVTDQSRPLLEAALRAGGGAEGRARIRVLGWVPDLVRVYQGATALIVTSRHEGFGLPAVEAMACGVPVIAFGNSATAEVVGAGGVLVPDCDVGAMAEQTASVLRSDARHAELAAAGLERSRSFSWSATAEAHAAIYRSIACA